MVKLTMKMKKGYLALSRAGLYHLPYLVLHLKLLFTEFHPTIDLTALNFLAAGHPRVGAMIPPRQMLT